jgi:hypothetical protein
MPINSTQDYFLRHCLHNPRFWDYVGGVFTFATVAPSGLYSGLWADLLLANRISSAARATPDLIAGFTSMAGKYALIRFFNRQAFQDLAQVNWKELVSSAEFWAPKNLVNYFITMNVSGTFAFLGCLSLLYTAEFAKNYGTDSGDLFEQAITSLPVQILIAGTTFFSNTLSFSTIIPNTYHQTIALLSSLHASTAVQTAYLTEQTKLNAVSNALICKFNALVNALNSRQSQAVDDVEVLYAAMLPEIYALLGRVANEPCEGLTAKEQLNNALALFDMQNNDAALKESMLALASSDLPTPSLVRYWLAVLLTLTIVGITVTGLSNFVQIAQDFGEWMHMRDAAVLVSVWTMLGIIPLGLTTLSYRTPIGGILQPPLRKVPIQLLAPMSYTVLDGLSIVICLLGGTANGYASLVIANQSIPIVVTSLAAPFFIELLGTMAWSRLDFEAATLKKLHEKCHFIGVLHHLVNKTRSIDATLPQSSYPCRFIFSGSQPPIEHPELEQVARFSI